MCAESNFYQISGFCAHSNGWFKQYDDKPMMNEIMAMDCDLFRPGGKGSPVELVLGILPSGASYLLMTKSQITTFTRKHHLGFSSRKPWTAREFLSLSPIYFHSLKELSEKITTYKQRPRNRNRQKSEKAEDNSQANRGYVKTGADVVHYRAYFEQQRTLYRLLAQDLEPAKVGLAPPPWLSGIRVVSLVFGEWMADDRRRNDRLKDPRLVDVGWTDATFPSFFERLTGSTVHLMLKSTSKMKNPDSKKAYFSEAVEDDRGGLYQRLRRLLSHDADKSGMPLVVIVHDEDMARSVLSCAGVNVELWSSGLSNLLPLPPVKNHSSSIPGPSIIDMQKLVRAMMETDPGYSVPRSAKVLHMQTDTRTCAGDDSLLLLRMWMSMAQGLAIDEQHKERLSHEPPCAQVLAPPQGPPSADVDPNDSDPNDAGPNDMPQAPGPRPTIADDFSDDDDW